MKKLMIEVLKKAWFLADSLKQVALSEAEGIIAEVGKTESGDVKIHQFIFDGDQWTQEKAEKWIEEKKGMTEVILEGKNFEIDFNAKDNHEIKPITKVFSCEIKNFNEEDRSFEAIASTEDKDRDGDILRASGWRLKNYRKNPVGLWGHNTLIPPIFKTTEIGVIDKKLAFKAKFAPKEIHPFADQIFQLYKNGFLKAFSVRFDPSKWENIKDEDGGQRYYFGRDYKEQDLLEISATAVPALPAALANKQYQDMIVKSHTLQHIDKITDPKVKQELLGTMKSLDEIEGKAPPAVPNPPVKKKPEEQDDTTTIKCKSCEEDFSYKASQVEGNLITCTHCRATLDLEGNQVELKQNPSVINLNIADIEKAPLVLEILKSGRILSEANKKLIKGCTIEMKAVAKNLNKTAKILEDLVVATSTPRSIDDMLDDIKTDLDEEEINSDEVVKQLIDLIGKNEVVLSSLLK